MISDHPPFVKRDEYLDKAVAKNFVYLLESKKDNQKGIASFVSAVSQATSRSFKRRLEAVLGAQRVESYFKSNIHQSDTPGLPKTIQARGRDSRS